MHLASVLRPLVFLGLLFLPAAFVHGDEEPPAKIKNPYYEKTEWKVWRDNPEPLGGVTTLVREGKAKKQVEVTLTVPEAGKRSYPTPPKDDGPYAVFQAAAKASPTYAGLWDDVYSSWSGLHGYLRTRWRSEDGSNVTVRGGMIDFVDVNQNQMLRAGVNFIHQSTTGMGHAITNNVMPDRTKAFEKLYFSDLLITAPAHASLTDYRADRSQDLYTAHTPTMFQSVGSSDSETMGITKMVIAGAYLPPATKLRLKRHGLYPSALLYLWKASLPYDVPYGHELRHRLAYKSVGDRAVYAKIEKYRAWGMDRGDMSLAYHCFDDGRHMRAMIDLAQRLDVAPPEAILRVTDVKNEGKGSYRLKKSVLVVQEKGKDVTIQVSSADSYDLQDLPLRFRWRLLYGNKQTSVVRSADVPNAWTIHVPWVDDLPEGRTAIALIANNGRFDGNPAIVTIYRKVSKTLPPPGLGAKDYTWPGAHTNRRPIVLNLQDQFVKRGGTLRLDLHAVDPEGRVVTFHKRSEEPGALDGNRFTWKCPRKEPEGTRRVTVIASDETSGSSYGGAAFDIHIEKPAVLAQIEANKWTGKAPLTVKLSGKPSIGKKLTYRWDIYARKRGRKPVAGNKWTSGRQLTHKFDKPGIYEVTLAVAGAGGEDEETVRILVTSGATKRRPSGLRVECNGVLVADGTKTTSAFRHTAFGVADRKNPVTRVFRLSNPSAKTIKLDAKKGLSLTGPGAEDFRISQKPRRTLEPGASTDFAVTFRPKEPGLREANVALRVGAKVYQFALSGGRAP